MRALFKYLILSLFIGNVHIPVSFAQHEHQAAAHAPIGVMGEHVHNKGEWMTSYRYMRMDMDTHFNGFDEVTVSDVHNDFMIAPTDMSMEMHMLGVMYGVSDEITAMLMVPYVKKDMDHINRSGVTFSTQAKGIGDVKFSGLFLLNDMLDDWSAFSGESDLILNFGLSFPTGSINQRDDTLAGPDEPLPYPMQIGSGTYDLLPGLTYTAKRENSSWARRCEVYYV